jgi:hypothetical protein
MAEVVDLTAIVGTPVTEEEAEAEFKVILEQRVQQRRVREALCDLMKTHAPMPQPMMWSMCAEDATSLIAVFPEVMGNRLFGMRINIDDDADGVTLIPDVPGGPLLSG